ncbi:hypothetical protein FGIG_11993 [Fasciola gigantica]|uniref:EGF-like domain-containing protein n=1 Tax=Fasciola gigantica TaxID=46835 RepID=A0A504YRT4_FASGI|nr:hypothetical protein FGIG_11993 [Fasciola gigantica]
MRAHMGTAIHVLRGFVLIWISREVLTALPYQQSRWFDRCAQTLLTSNFSQECALHGGQLAERLCLTQRKNDTILGADFSNCNLSTFPADFPKSDVQFVFLGTTYLPSNGTEYCGFINLSYVLLNATNECPGAQYSWVIDRVLDGDYRECRDQLEFCNTTKHVFSCPPNARCQFNGPGCLTCLCEPDYFGYKCMFRRGFPTITFTLTLLAVMVTLTALFRLYRRFRPSIGEPVYSAIPPTHDD